MVYQESRKAMVKQKHSSAITLERAKKKKKKLNFPSLLVSIFEGLSMTQ